MVQPVLEPMLGTYTGFSPAIISPCSLWTSCKTCGVRTVGRCVGSHSFHVPIGVELDARAGQLWVRSRYLETAAVNHVLILQLGMGLQFGSALTECCCYFSHCPAFLPPTTSVVGLESSNHTWAMGCCSFWAVPGCRVFPSSEAQYLDPKGRMYHEKINPRHPNINTNAMQLRDIVDQAQVGGMCCPCSKLLDSFP